MDNSTYRSTKSKNFTLAKTKSRTKSGTHLTAEAKCLPKVRWYFWPKMKPEPKVDRPRIKSSQYIGEKETNQYTCPVQRHSQSQTAATAPCRHGFRSPFPQLKWGTGIYTVSKKTSPMFSAINS